MLTLIIIIVVLLIAWVIIKNSLNFLFAGFSLTITLFLGIGFVMFILSGLANVISPGTAWAITLVPTSIAFVYEVYRFATDPEQIKENYKRNKKSRYGFDEKGNEIDLYPGRERCGNCRFNKFRPPYTGGHGWCKKRGYFNDTYVIPDSVTYHDEHEVRQDYGCRHWEHF